jgi:3-deoxy-D-manno-octulosonic acid kinase
MNEAAAAGEEALAHIAGGAMLYDASCLGQPDPEVFDLEHWRARGALDAQPGGRGSIAFVHTLQGQRWVLRHYHRGGMVANLLGDRYFWTGASRTRAFREWRLLRRLRDWGLRVPQPVAARYRRDGLCYRADLLTVELPVRRTLAQAVNEAALPDARWTAVGRAIGALHRHGVQHADLNAHNLLLGAADDEVYVLDFDRGRIRSRGAWEARVLARLHRSLQKVTRELPAGRFVESNWRALLAGAGVRG